MMADYGELSITCPAFRPCQRMAANYPIVKYPRSGNGSLPVHQIINMKGIIVILSVCLTSLSSCYYDVEEDLYPSGGSCDSSAVTYSGTVTPILQSNGCTGCHSGGASSGNILLAAYANVKKMGQKGKLYGAI